MNTLLLSNILEKNANWFTDKWNAFKPSVTPSPGAQYELNNYINPVGIGAGIGALGLGFADALGNHDDEEKGDRVPNLLKSMALGGVLGGGGGAMYQASKDIFPGGKPNLFANAHNPQLGNDPHNKNPDLTKDSRSLRDAFMASTTDVPSAVIAGGGTGLGLRYQIKKTKELNERIKKNPPPPLPTNRAAADSLASPAAAQLTANQMYSAQKAVENNNKTVHNNLPLKKQTWDKENWIKENTAQSQQWKDVIKHFTDNNGNFTHESAKAFKKHVGTVNFNRTSFDPFAGETVKNTGITPAPHEGGALGGYRNPNLKGSSRYPVNTEAEILTAIKSNLNQPLTWGDRLKGNIYGMYSKVKDMLASGQQHPQSITPLEKNIKHIWDRWRLTNIKENNPSTTISSQYKPVMSKEMQFLSSNSISPLYRRLRYLKPFAYGGGLYGTLKGINYIGSGNDQRNMANSIDGLPWTMQNLENASPDTLQRFFPQKQP